jgi:hypothetical protein
MSWNEYREERRDIDRAVRWTGGRIILVVIISLVVVGLIGVAIWGINVAISGPKGQGDGIIQNNSSENWIKQQAKFEDLYAEYEATLVRIDQFKTIADANPNDAIAQTNYNGQISHCTDVVAEYNAASRSFLSEDWKSIDLPPSLDADDCVPAAK